MFENSEVNNNHKNRYGKLKTILSIWSFKLKRFPDGIIMIHNDRLCANVSMKQWGVN